MERMKRGWKRTPGAVRKPVILIIGSAVIAGGVILLPLPGPGWVVIFLGFAILATEFEKAERVRDWTVGQFKRLYAWMKDKKRELEEENEREKQAELVRKHKH